MYIPDRFDLNRLFELYLKTKKITYIKTSSLNRKFSQIVAAIVLVIMAFNLWLNVFYKSEYLLDENVQVLADNILLQTAHNARLFIEQDDIRALQQLTSSALRSEHILDMLIYDTRGVELAKSSNASSTLDRFVHQPNAELAWMEPAPFVTEIRNDNHELLGFVRITVLKRKLQQQGKSYLQAISKQIFLLAVLAGIIGYLLTIGLRPFSKNAYTVEPD